MAVIVRTSNYAAFVSILNFYGMKLVCKIIEQYSISFYFSYFLLLAHYVPNVAKEEL